MRARFEGEDEGLIKVDVPTAQYMIPSKESMLRFVTNYMKKRKAKETVVIHGGGMRK